MTLPSEGKLVRDGIPAIVDAAGGTYVLTTLDPGDMWQALTGKVHEEATEVAEATTADEQLEELADLYELILALADQAGTTIDAVAEAAEHKRAKRGGFQQRLWMTNYRPS